MTKLIRGFAELPARPEVVATIGKFDGLHLGHQQILNQMQGVKSKTGAKSLVISFYSNPASYFKPNLPKKRITSLREQLIILGKFSVDYLLLLRFNQRLMEISAEVFLEEFLFKKLNVQELIVGRDAVLGKDREGDVEYLKKKFSSTEKKLSVCSFTEKDGVKISSSLLRTSIIEGDLELYENLTNRKYSLTGLVVSGQKLARSLGFPTANLKYSRLHLPPTGVYATKVTLAGKEYLGITNIGFRPTVIAFADHPQIETYLIGYQGADFYNQIIKLEFLSYIRPEQKFASLLELTEQIKVDLETRLKLS